MNKKNQGMIRSNLHLCRLLMLVALFTIPIPNVLSQTRLVLNGAKINLNQGAYLVIDNSAANAITRNSGHIISEGENNRIKWSIGTTTGTYTIPWGYGNTDYIPLTFIKTAGTGSGYFLFSTYHTTWNNIAQLPTGVTNINGASGTDNSAFVSDRFWQINAQSYSTKPSLTNLVFTYLDIENGAPNTVTESALRAKRYNSSLNSWTDNILTNTLNTTANTLTVSSVDVANLQDWWMLGTLNANRYWVAPSNSNSSISANWSETPGGIGNAGPPTLGDAVVFDGSSDFNCTLNADLFASSLTVDPGFLGTIIQGSNAVTINGDATFSGGNFTGGPSNLSVNGNLTVSGASFTAPSAAIDVKGDLSVTSGTFVHNNGTVVFSGTNGTTQNISSTIPTTFNNISATNTAASPGVRVQSSQNLKGILTLTSNVNFDADGASNNAVFKLLSTGDNPTQDAAVAVLPSGAQVSGKVTVQRFMTKEGSTNNRIYRYISSPVQIATVADLQQEIPVSGTFTGRSLCTGCTTNQSLFAYNEAVITDTDGNGTVNQHDGYIDFPDVTNTETFQPGRGYALFVRGNILSSTLWDLRGPINSGNVAPLAFPITYTTSGTLANDGWNLVGNPFPSTIDWNAASGWTKTNLDATIYMTDNGNLLTQTAYWNGVTGVNGGSRYIATGQGFWIKANGAPVLQANENVKKPGTQTTFIREGTPDNLLRITMINGSTRDEAVIHFREDATEKFDSNADAIKLPNSTFNLSSIQPDGRALAINSVSLMDCKSEIKLNVENATAGSYRLDFSEYESFSDITELTLADNFTGSSFDIRSDADYNFSVTSNPASFGSGRFKITFALPQLSSDFVATAAPVCEASDAVIQIDNSQPDVTYVATTERGAHSTSVVGNGGTINLMVSGDSLTTGENNIIVKSTRMGCTSQVEKSIALNVAQTLEVTSVEGGKSCREGIVTLKAVGAPEDSYYNWYETESTSSPIADQHAGSFTTSSLPKSKTYFVSIVNALGCEGPRHPVTAEVILFDDAQISESGDLLISNFLTGNQWYFNHEVMPADTGQSITPQQSGTYGLQVNIEGCIASAEREFVITGTESSMRSSISVFPNPVLKETTVTLPESFKGLKEIRIISSAGQIVASVEITDHNEDNKYVVDMTDIPTGVYILRAIGNAGVTELKVIKD